MTNEIIPNLRRITSPQELVFGKIIEPETLEPLLPVIVVDGLSLAIEGLPAIRMQGYANYEAVRRTLDEGVVTFWSRSQKGLWTKGAESGNLLLVRDTYTDCDADSLLINAKPIGPTCHTGTRSCFETKGIGE